MSLNMTLHAITKCGTEFEIPLRQTPTTVTMAAMVDGADPRKIYFDFLETQMCLDPKTEQEQWLNELNIEHKQWVEKVLDDNTLTIEWSYI